MVEKGVRQLFLDVVRVTVCDESGNPLKGFEASQPITADTINTVVKWKGASLKPLSGKTVRLKFPVQRAKLFAYWFE